MIIKKIDDWDEVVDSCEVTVSKCKTKKIDLTSEWKRRMLIAEHSPIRCLIFSWKWEDIKTWISTHIVRHDKFALHFVGTQRTDRTGIDRDDLSQSEPVDHKVMTNAQEIINISRKRLCNKSHKETKAGWQVLLQCLVNVEPELVKVCVPECVYRGFCPEMSSCGFYKNDEFKEQLREYRKGINGNE